MLGHRLILLVGLVTELQAAYDEEIAKNFASLSSVTYCENLKNVLDWTCGACQDSKTPLVPGKIKIIEGGVGNATRIMVGKLAAQNGCLVAFRGSENVINWVRDFEFWDIVPSSYEDCEGCRVHTGFYQIWQNLRDQVVKSLVDVGCGPDPNNVDNLLYITGHSMGAALVHLSMFTLKNAAFNIAKSYSFEAPRVGNKAFSDAFSDQFTRQFPVYRITHSQDPVVHVPPEALGFVHVQQEIYYDSTGKYKVCPNVEDTACADQHWDVPYMIVSHVDDHCASPLVPNGAICSPTGCASSEQVVV
jgi:hypothetical protein